MRYQQDQKANLERRERSEGKEESGEREYVAERMSRNRSYNEPRHEYQSYERPYEYKREGSSRKSEGEFSR